MSTTPSTCSPPPRRTGCHARTPAARRGWRAAYPYGAPDSTHEVTTSGPSRRHPTDPTNPTDPTGSTADGHPTGGPPAPNCPAQHPFTGSLTTRLHDRFLVGLGGYGESFF